MSITGIVLAGGKGSRMGGVDKGLQPLRGKPMVEWVLARFAPQVDGDPHQRQPEPAEPTQQFGHRVVSDEIGGFAGPLAGLHAGLNAATHPLVVTVPCDSPFLAGRSGFASDRRIWETTTWPSPRPAISRTRCSR